MIRDSRQECAFQWCASVFGAAQAQNMRRRSLRLLEEAVEAYQATGGNQDIACRLVRSVFTRPVGALHQELGGVGLSLLALAEAAGLSADEEEARELARVLSKSPNDFAMRDKTKDGDGFSGA